MKMKFLTINIALSEGVSHAFFGENQKGRREGDGKKMSRQFATNVTTIYDILRQLAQDMM